MNWEETRAAVVTDLFRYGGVQGCGAFVRALRREDGFKLTVYKRLAVFFRSAFPPFYLLFRFLFQRVCRKCCVLFPINLDMGTGIYISHCHGITINSNCRIGNNVNISQNITLGQANRGRYTGIPVIGNNVYIGPGATITGGITIGNNVLVSANSLVTRDVEDNSVMLGVPAVRVSDKGAWGYVEFTI